jgi:hypothetical protein
MKMISFSYLIETTSRYLLPPMLNEAAEMMFAPERYKTSIHFVFLFLWRGQHGKVRFRLLSWFRRTGKRRVEPTRPQFLEPVVQAPFSSMR